MMNQYTLLCIAFGVLGCLLSSTSSSSVVPMIFCQPNSMGDASPKVRQLCLELIERARVEEGRQDGNGELFDSQMYERGTKRQDVDHVFLRFGRRLGL